MSVILQTLVITITICIALVLVYRILINSGVPIKNFIPSQSKFISHSPTAKESWKVFGYSMLFRGFILLAGVVVFCLFSQKGTQFEWSNAFNNWKQWDARHYISISNGYGSYVEDGCYTTLVFFPLYPFLLNLVNYIIPSPIISGLLVSAIASSVACVYFYKLVCIDYGKSVAKTAVILLCIFPFAFFYNALMSEGVFLCTSVMTLYYIRRHKWYLAGICGFLCALSRSVGVFLVFSAAVELLEETRLLGNIKSGKVWISAIKKGLWLLLLPLGTLIHLYINYYITGDPLYFLAMEEEFWKQVSQPFYKIGATFWSVLSGGYDISFLISTFIPSLIFLVSAFALLVRGLEEHKTMYLCWILVCILVNTSISWPISLCRYIASIVPLYMILAQDLEKHSKLKISVFVSWGILFGIYFVGYLTSKQIM